VLAYERRFGTEFVWVAFNLGSESADVRLDVETTLAPAGHTPAVRLAGRTVYDPINDLTATLGEGTLQFEIPPGSVRVWVLR
jgi:hypothetical protein